MPYLRVAINLNPYQGLKHGQTHPWTYSVTVAININPYQGLKRVNPALKESIERSRL